jgi:serine phosphatase RsbU (regulator of sigma subunit)
MVLYTDGVVEARRHGHEQFGIDRTIESATLSLGESAAAICCRILDSVKAWSSEEVQDDQTVVVLRRLPHV